MVKTNYRAWSIDPSEFNDKLTTTEKLLYFARYAVLAPSGHNTQPWLLSTAGDTLSVAIHPDHHLSIDGSGLLSVEPYISIGAFLEVFELAAHGFGYTLVITLFPTKKQVASIKLSKKTAAQPELLDAITSRTSNRNPYQTDALPTKQLTNITSHTLKGVTSTLLTKRADIAFIGDRTEVALGSIMSNPLYRLELSKWVRTNHTKKYDGMPGFTHGFGNIASLASKAMIKHAPAGGPQGKKSKKLILDSAALLIVECKDDSKEAFVNAGRLYARVCVLANAAGIATSALGASVLDPVTRDEVKKQFGITSRPIYLLRLGKTSHIGPKAPRWPVQKLMSR